MLPHWVGTLWICSSIFDMTKVTARIMISFGSQPLALRTSNLPDTCPRRRIDLSWMDLHIEMRWSALPHLIFNFALFRRMIMVTVHYLSNAFPVWVRWRLHPLASDPQWGKFKAHPQQLRHVLHLPLNKESLNILASLTEPWSKEICLSCLCHRADDGTAMVSRRPTTLSAVELYLSSWQRYSFLWTAVQAMRLQIRSIR